MLISKIRNDLGKGLGANDGGRRNHPIAEMNFLKIHDIWKFF